MKLHWRRLVRSLAVSVSVAGTLVGCDSNGAVAPEDDRTAEEFAARFGNKSVLAGEEATAFLELVAAEGLRRGDASFADYLRERDEMVARLADSIRVARRAKASRVGGASFSESETYATSLTPENFDAVVLAHAMKVAFTGGRSVVNGSATILGTHADMILTASQTTTGKLPTYERTLATRSTSGGARPRS